MGNLLAGLVLSAGSRPTLIQELMAAKECHSADPSLSMQIIYCEFKVSGFHPSVDGAGESNAGFTV